jgi:hypothetical protein
MYRPELIVWAGIKGMGWNLIKGLESNKRAGIKCAGLN